MAAATGSWDSFLKVWNWRRCVKRRVNLARLFQMYLWVPPLTFLFYADIGTYYSTLTSLRSSSGKESTQVNSSDTLWNLPQTQGSISVTASRCDISKVAIPTHCIQIRDPQETSKWLPYFLSPNFWFSCYDYHKDLNYSLSLDVSSSGLSQQVFYNEFYSLFSWRNI